MDFFPEPKTIEDIFSIKKKMVIPRFQREFSWERDKLQILWDDLLDNLVVKNSILQISEYFLGSLVVIDDKDNPASTERLVVDGQQRLTVITIFFSTLYEIFTEIKESKLADIVYNYVVTNDNNGESITLLETESPKPFFQFRIQAREKDTSAIPNSQEEKRLLDAYLFFKEKLSEKKLPNEIRSHFGLILDHLSILKLIRDQVLKSKIVYVSVKSLKDAYMIFEVLNAKGEPLNTVDLVKNSLLKILDDTEPADFAVEKWNNIKKNIEKMDDLNTFYRHFWLSNYNFITEKKLFQDFSDKIKVTKTEYRAFLNSLEKASNVYKKILEPNKEDWNTSEKISIFYTLQAFDIFKVSQVRSILLALFDAYSAKKINLKALKYYLLFLENFHFVFSAICSARPSGLESRYSKYSLILHKEIDKNKINAILKAFENAMRSSIPSYEEFEKGIQQLWLTDDNDKDKKKIQYILAKIERNFISTNEIDILCLSIEHISPQSKKLQGCGYLGNLLPLGDTLNSEIGGDDFKNKLKAYEKSNFKTVKKFCELYGNNTDWTTKDIENRTKKIADHLYHNICKF